MWANGATLWPTWASKATWASSGSSSSQNEGLWFSFVSFQSLIVILTNFETVQNWDELQFSLEKKSLPNIMCVSYTSKKKEKKEREGRKRREGGRKGNPWRSSGWILVFPLPRAWFCPWSCGGTTIPKARQSSQRRRGEKSLLGK